MSRVLNDVNVFSELFQQPGDAEEKRPCERRPLSVLCTDLSPQRPECAIAPWFDTVSIIACRPPGEADAWRPFVEVVRLGNVALLYSARDTRYNNAVALKAYVGIRRAAKGRQ